MYLRSDRAIILGVALHGEVEDGLLVLVLEQTEDRVRFARYNLSSLFRNVFQVDRDTCSGLYGAVKSS